ncbi:branched-chain amino acid ABC transporter substrate-binding protein [Arthrobacter sp. FW306-05-C]|uniref:branched-chain amino acid ABC transporter substrate-binding protein n=1 Tax=Arthrobacter TaxID=1663 RepID=UPI001EEF8E35|nr:MULTISPECIES: branched-chain amino acid ABC transporter substrate-binding protein [Arthrobacter]MDP9986777.1 branched-chain amino acid transport system substrate-binding protein [Arthrobacter oryzae]UKA67894.1 branched-chain amino acid ABC transporter substrate-binding protein [Arthrobacter sp. FW306-05-C]UKA72421.1 branched-chain amino acid ABC transporter substrate-binding protein [Arthrobacter sp. FW306-06-A]UKA76652.1 branched-chain amino acid ABC transporter substrate-binding protein [A
MYRKKVLTSLAAAATFSMLLSACANQAGPGTTESSGSSGKVNIPAISKVDVPAGAVKPAGDGKATCPATTTLAYAGAQTGPNAQLGVNIFNGIQLAIDQHNKANPGCQVQFKKFDTEGDPNKATGPVTQMVSEPDIVGVVGLPFSGESKATGNIFEQKGLVHITPSATNPTLTENGWTTFFRGLGNDAVQGPAAAKFLTGKLGAKKVYLVQDDSDYGIGLGTSTSAGLGSALAGTEKVTTGQKDFSAVISKIMNAKADAVFYAGYYAEGAPFDQQLVGKGFTGTFVAPDGVKDDQFIKQAGDASNNAYFTCPCIPGELITDFASAYKDVSKGAEPGTYSIEGYDAATVLLSGIDAGKQSRADLLAWVKAYDKDGLSKHYKWDAKGELQAPTVYGYKVENGKIVPVGPIGE